MWGGRERQNARKNIEIESGEKNMKMANLRGKGWGDHGSKSKFYLINEWKIQCEIFRIKIHEESVKMKEIEIFEKRG